MVYQDDTTEYGNQQEPKPQERVDFLVNYVQWQQA